MYRHSPSNLDGSNGAMISMIATPPIGQLLPFVTLPPLDPYSEPISPFQSLSPKQLNLVLIGSSAAGAETDSLTQFTTFGICLVSHD